MDWSYWFATDAMFEVIGGELTNYEWIRVGQLNKAIRQCFLESHGGHIFEHHIWNVSVSTWDDFVQTTLPFHSIQHVKFEYSPISLKDSLKASMSTHPPLLLSSFDWIDQLESTSTSLYRVPQLLYLSIQWTCLKQLSITCRTLAQCDAYFQLCSSFFQDSHGNFIVMSSLESLQFISSQQQDVDERLGWHTGTQSVVDTWAQITPHLRHLQCPSSFLFGSPRHTVVDIPIQWQHIQHLHLCSSIYLSNLVHLYQVYLSTFHHLKEVFIGCLITIPTDVDIHPLQYIMDAQMSRDGLVDQPMDQPMYQSMHQSIDVNYKTSTTHSIHWHLCPCTFYLYEAAKATRILYQEEVPATARTLRKPFLIFESLERHYQHLLKRFCNEENIPFEHKSYNDFSSLECLHSSPMKSLYSVVRMNHRDCESILNQSSSSNNHGSSTIGLRMYRPYLTGFQSSFNPKGGSHIPHICRAWRSNFNAYWSSLSTLLR
ncbi:MAG: hypothetical protein Sylvanvirus36_4 [Sylvanvirus sp.]|uniref:Uncharacterized protein n=1 Tax=Sylvanvirus sp. TaxID=2487774 RepID=A0A3G5AJ38_9VIRU|nr:MAG: hypothetical protein Sylvanvirus36_4 [Sylvanvirus sp.]